MSATHFVCSINGAGSCRRQWTRIFILEFADLLLIANIATGRNSAVIVQYEVHYALDANAGQILIPGQW